MWLVKLTLMAAAAYGVLVGITYFMQTWLIFPASLAGGAIDLPASATHQRIEKNDADSVIMVRVASRTAPAEPRPLLLGFGGNAWNADAVAVLLHRVFPQHDVAALHYRGYGPSKGRPSAEKIFDDARSMFDQLTGQSDAGIVAVGFSIGASVAVDLAAARQVRGLVLVTPFDSLKELAAFHYPWLPVRWLLRHRMESASTLQPLDVPAAIITAENDTVVPASRSQPVVSAAKNLRENFEIKGTGHNDIYDTQAFVSALRESVEAVTLPETSQSNTD